MTAPKHTAGRRGRPIGLSTPTVNPLLTFEHHDAIRALSTLLVQDSPNVATGTETHPVRTRPLGGTRRILNALSAADATMSPHPHTRNDRVA